MKSFVGHRLLKQAKNGLSRWSFPQEGHRALISSLLSPSQKECEIYLSREQNNVAVFTNRISWRKITVTSLTEDTGKNRFSECYAIVLYEGPNSARNILTSLNSNADRNPGRLTCRAGLRGGTTGEIAPCPAARCIRDEIYLFHIKCSFETFSWFRSDTRIHVVHSPANSTKH